MQGHYDVVKYLLDIPVSIDYPQIPQFDAPCNAASLGHVNIGKLLLDRGARATPAKQPVKIDILA